MLEYFSNGKLLLTSEYVVLDGALAIGLPTKLGQSLEVTEQPSTETSILWSAILCDGKLWFEAELDQNLNCTSSTESNLGKTIAEILKFVASLKHGIFKDKQIHFRTKLDFPTEWGLGSSSTLISLLSKYADVDAFELLEMSFGGSGYDVSCALFPRTQTFQLTSKGKKVNFINLNSNITQHCYFVYLNQKQNSREGIQKYRSIGKDKDLIKSISDLSLQIIDSKDLTEFEDILDVHEFLLSEHLGLERVQNKLFHDYKRGIVKSLGAWGGDFVLVTSPDDDLSYFQRKGYHQIFAYHDLIV